MSDRAPAGHRRLPPWIDGTVRAVLVARLAMSGSRAIAAVVVPVYLADRGYSGAALGALFVVVAVTSAGMSGLVGLYSDRLGRRPFLVGVPLLTAVAAVAFTLSRSVGVVFGFAALGSFGRGGGAGGGTVGPYQPAETALLADVVPPLQRNEAFGYLGFVSAIGALLGGLLTALLAPHGGGEHTLAAVRPAFLAAAVLALAAGVAACWIREPPARERPVGPRRLLPRRSWPVLARLGTTNAVNGLAVGMFGPFVSYWFHERFGVGAGTIGALYAVVNLATVPATLGAASVARRRGIVRATVTLRGIQAVLLVPMVLSPYFWLAGAIYLLRMVVQRMGLPLRQSYAIAIAHPDERASVAGLSRLPGQATSAVSPLAAGYLFDHVSLALPFLVGGALQAAYAALYWAFFHRIRPVDEREAPTAGADP